MDYESDIENEKENEGSAILESYQDELEKGNHAFKDDTRFIEDESDMSDNHSVPSKRPRSPSPSPITTNRPELTFNKSSEIEGIVAVHRTIGGTKMMAKPPWKGSSGGGDGFRGVNGVKYHRESKGRDMIREEGDDQRKMKKDIQKLLGFKTQIDQSSHSNAQSQYRSQTPTRIQTQSSNKDPLINLIIIISRK